jgi:hypothetical protein
MRSKLSLVVLGVLSASACSQSASVPLTGEWNGTASNGKAFRYTFAADDTFQYGRVDNGAFGAVMAGAYSFDSHTLSLDGTVLDESGALVRFTLDTDAYASATSLCDQAFSAEGRSGVVATWTSVTTSQAFDVSGNPTGDAQSTVDIFDLHADGTVDETLGGLTQSGTYVQTGTAVTISIGTGSVRAVRTFTLVDDQVLCDPAYVH